MELLPLDFTVKSGDSFEDRLFNIAAFRDWCIKGADDGAETRQEDMQRACGIAGKQYGKQIQTGARLPLQ